ncbi:MAG TPA: hypothetical protein VGV17_17115 [Bosea sp. (in: a-proteobacteria)]|uniref:hypothetical protein n=1 Tax=Bosea sp. (in: a-proteobacteria) TaxID=1871050 RepID=UPI002DDD9980|nr:hypothetical protein [Bosea sp. (in: a-proteobacteria)]HEV2555477.1 hypothetical protein [Bosea sp. (in: a-proteobacteria)]
MTRHLPDDIQRDLETMVRAKAGESRVLDVEATAREILGRHRGQDVEIGTVVASVARLAGRYGCAVQLGGRHDDDGRIAAH